MFKYFTLWKMCVYDKYYAKAVVTRQNIATNKIFRRVSVCTLLLTRSACTRKIARGLKHTRVQKKTRKHDLSPTQQRQNFKPKESETVPCTFPCSYVAEVQLHLIRARSCLRHQRQLEVRRRHCSAISKYSLLYSS